MNNSVKQRCIRFIATFRTPVSQFCDMTGISRSAFYQWKRDELELSTETLQRISDFLNQFGF